MELLTITVKQANMWINECAYEGQRKIKPNHVNYLASEMTRGNFLDTQVIAIGHLDGRSYLINGNHTLRAIVKCGIPQRMRVVHHTFQNKKELVRYYSRYDIGSGRNFTDAASAYVTLEEFSGLASISPGYQKKLAAAVKIIMADFNFTVAHHILKSNGVNHEDVVIVAESWSSEMKSLMHCVTSKGNSRQVINGIFRSPTNAIALYTFRYQPESAREFWKYVASDDMLGKKDPRKTLNKYLVTTGLSKSLSHQVEKRDHIKAVGYKTAAAWNAFFENRELTRLQVNKKLQIAGTPKI